MLAYNFALSWHGLRRHPRTTLLVVLTMALGLASALTTLTLLHVLSADPLPGLSRHLYLAWVDSRQALRADESDDPGVPSALTLVDARALVAAHRATRQAMMSEFLQNVGNEDGSRSQGGQMGLAASSELFPLFGIPLSYGRYWTMQEDDVHAPVAVIAAGLSEKLFGTANGVGRTVKMNGKPFRVIGVSGTWAPNPHFHQLRVGNAFNVVDSVFVPVGALLDAGMGPFMGGDCDREVKTFTFGKVDVQRCRWLTVWTQLDTAEQVAGYRRFLRDYAGQQKAAGRFERAPRAELYGVPAWLELNRVVPDNVRLNVWLAGGFLLLCLVNVAGLLAARFLRRSTEIGVRRALGAPRRAIFAQCLGEAGLAGLAGGVLALPLTLFGLWIVRRQNLGYTELARLDPAMFAALFALALGAGVLVGVLPAWRACRVEPGLQVKSA